MIGRRSGSATRVQRDSSLVFRMSSTLAETREAAAAGNADAIRALPATEKGADRAGRAEAMELRSPGQLPKLDLAGPTRFAWDFEDRNEERWTVIRVATVGREVWRELAYYEGGGRFLAIRDLLAARYGNGFAGLVPAFRSATWLYGDRAVPSAVSDAGDATNEETPWIHTGR